MPFAPKQLAAARQLNQAVAEHHRVVDLFRALHLSLVPSEVEAPYEEHCPWMESWLETPPTGADTQQVADGRRWSRKHKGSRDRFWEVGYRISLRVAQRYMRGKYRDVQQFADVGQGPSDEFSLLKTEYDFASDTIIQLGAQLCRGTIWREQGEEGRLKYIWHLVRSNILDSLRKRGQPPLDPLLGDLWLDFERAVAGSEQLRPHWQAWLAVVQQVDAVQAEWSRFTKLATTWGDPDAFRQWQRSRGRKRQKTDAGPLHWRWRDLQTEIRRSKAVSTQWQAWQQAVEQAGGEGDAAGLAWHDFVSARHWTRLDELDAPPRAKVQDGSEQEWAGLEIAGESWPTPDQEAEWSDRLHRYFVNGSGDAETHIRRCYTLLRLASGATEGEIAAEYLALDEMGMPLRRRKKRHSGVDKPVVYNPLVSQDQKYNLRALSNVHQEDAGDWDVDIYRWVRSRALDTWVQLTPEAWQTIHHLIQADPQEGRRATAVLCWLWDMARPLSAARRADLRQRQRQRPGCYLFTQIEQVAGVKVGYSLQLEITWAALVPSPMDSAPGRSSKSIGPHLEAIVVHQITGP